MSTEPALHKMKMWIGPRYGEVNVTDQEIELRKAAMDAAVRLTTGWMEYCAARNDPFGVETVSDDGEVENLWETEALLVIYARMLRASLTFMAGKEMLE